MPQPTVQAAGREAATIDDLHAAVILARRDIAHGRPPGITATDASCLFSDVFETDFDRVSGTAVAALLRLAGEHGLSDAGREAFEEDALGVILDALDEMFWLGLTAGHVRIGGDVSIPRRLLPAAA